MHFKSVGIRAVKAVVLAISCTMPCSSCGFEFEIYESESEIGKRCLKQLTTAIESGDNSQVKSLVAPNIANETEDIDSSVSELVSFYRGSYVSDTMHVPYSCYDTDGGISKKWLGIDCDVVTTEAVYSFSLYWCIKDTGDAGNVGMWMLYVFDYEDNPSGDFSFLEDGWKNGIHVVEF